MTRSLAEDLRTLAHSSPADPGAEIADRAGQMVRAIRRRRAARQTGMSAVGVSAAAAVVIGVTNGPGWLTTGPAGGGPEETSTAPTADPTGDPTADATAEPTFEPTLEPTLEPTPGPTSGPAGGIAPENGVAMVAELYGLDLGCGATFTRETLGEAGASWADHLTPRFAEVPTAVDQPARLVNEYGRETPGLVLDGWTRMTPAVVITANDVVVGFGGGALQNGEPTAAHQDYVVDLPGLAICPTPPAGTIYTVYTVSSEAGFDGQQRTKAPTADEEHLTASFPLSIDLATGEQWFGGPQDKETALADGFVPLP